MLGELVLGGLTTERSSEERQELARWKRRVGGYQHQAWKGVPNGEGSTCRVPVATGRAPLRA